MSEALAPTKHWRLGPSSSKRWLVCPVSAVDDAPDQQNEHTIRGNILHEMAAAYFMDGLPIFGEGVDPDHVRISVAQAEKLIGPHTEVVIEKSIQCVDIVDHGGTIDVLLYEPAEKLLTVFDYKFGSYAVPAKENTQLACYLTLAQQVFPEAEQFQGAIMQPKRRKSVDLAPFTMDALLTHKEKVRWAATSDHYETGEHCRFCPLRPECEAGTQYAELRNWY